MLFKASAPGSLMLLGEYAVLTHHQAIVCALNKRMVVTLTPHLQKEITIHSALGHYHSSLAKLAIKQPFQFILGVLKLYQSRLKAGCHIEIQSAFSEQIGFGSSAAVTVATLAVVNAWLNRSCSKLDLIKQGRRVVKLVQGNGSGADISASVFGGVVAYQAYPLKVEKFASILPLIAIFSGFKTPTREAIQIVQNTFATYPNIFKPILLAIHQCVLNGVLALQQNDWKTLGRLMTIQQGLMTSLGVSVFPLPEIVNELTQQSEILGAKISGSGFGDCAIGLGEMNIKKKLNCETLPGVFSIPVTMASEGVRFEKT